MDNQNFRETVLALAKTHGKAVSLLDVSKVEDFFGQDSQPVYVTTIDSAFSLGVALSLKEAVELNIEPGTPGITIVG